jgi:translation initiation factor 3 subunit G
MWDELEEDDGGDLDFLLLPRMVIRPDAKGLKNVIEYHFVDEGNKVKVTTTTRHCRPSPRSATARHAWRSCRYPRSSCMER